MALQIFLTRSEVTFFKFILANDGVVDKNTKITEKNRMELIEQEAIVLITSLSSVVYLKCLKINNDVALKEQSEGYKSNAIRGSQNL